MPQLAAWDSFYVIVGSSAAALTGLMFVVVTLIAQEQMASSHHTFAAFATPTIVHFCEALLISAALSAPWPTLRAAGAFLDVCGAGGFVYCLVVLRRTQRQTDYKPLLEDWVWHVVFPHAAYIAVVAGGVALVRDPLPALFTVAAATIALVFIGIHNAWDTVTFLALDYEPPNTNSAS